MWVKKGSTESWRILLGVRKAIEKSYATEDLLLYVARNLLKDVPLTKELWAFLLEEGFVFTESTSSSTLFNYNPGVLEWRVREDNWWVLCIEKGCLFLWVGGDQPCPELYKESMAKELG